MTISKIIECDMGHRLPNHKSKCSNMHGHRYKFEVIVDGAVLIAKGDSSEGMVIDFGDLKTIMKRVIEEPLDHGFMISKEDPYLPFFTHAKTEGQKVIIVDFIPTVENIAYYIFTKLHKELQIMNINLTEIKVWETPTSMASVTSRVKMVQKEQ